MQKTTLDNESPARQGEGPSMLTDSPIIAFASITNAERAREFYEQVLGLRFVEDSPFAMVFDASGTMLRLSKVESLTAIPYTVLGWQVADIQEELGWLVSMGVTFARYEGLPQDESGICTFPGGDKVAWFHDPDGNLLSLTQFA
jgi:catechol 2,3-dioxygenase-like lactoylglutathione lyase family enzyme